MSNFNSSVHPKVFISYSHDSEEHQEKVLNFADHLRDKEIDCNIDQYEESPSEDWPTWVILKSRHTVLRRLHQRLYVS